MTISKCEHGKYLDMCRICFPLPEPSKAINTFAKEMTEAFFPNGQVWIEKPELTLTDGEINKLWAESHEDGIAMQKGFTTQQHYFAWLILRKAQE